MSTSIAPELTAPVANAPVAPVTGSTRKPAGRPPKFNGENADVVLAYYRKVGRQVPVDFRGRPPKDSKKLAQRAKIQKFNARVAARAD